MKNRHLIFLIAIAIISSCQHAKRQSSGERAIDDLDVRQAVNLVLDVALINFEGADYCIFPYFHEGIPNSTFTKSFAENNSGINLTNQQMLDLISQYRDKEGSDLESYIINDSKINRISKSYNDLILTISPPMIDEAEQLIYFYVEALFPYNNSIASNDIFYGIKLHREKENDVETVSGVLEASFKVVN